ncbi:hypothetical protein [Nocardioides sp. AE5]|uniref:hypothetical protein n=1 Tax=Nocardioides sp. AE5 TaxID=2962573 RepID=UPI0028816883|nr:hypothetical protein [Nocardioides sp. AE5]MDT0200478.1 hypothetical protein [Nocardioides sp. AE5]
MSPKLTGVAVAALSMALSFALAACGSEGGGEQGNGGAANSDFKNAGDPGARNLPSGFPEDVPVPAGELRNGSAVGDVGWRLMVAVPLDADAEALKAEYTTLYEDAGFTVTNEGTSSNLQATNSDWRVDLVVRPPTITVQVLDY